MSASSASSPNAMPERTPASKGMRRALILAAAVALLLLGAAIPYLMHRFGPAGAPASARLLSFQPITFQQMSIFRAQFAP